MSVATQAQVADRWDGGRAQVCGPGASRVSRLPGRCTQDLLPRKQSPRSQTLTF